MIAAQIHPWHQRERRDVWTERDGTDIIDTSVTQAQADQRRERYKVGTARDGTDTINIIVTQAQADQ